MYRLYPSNGMYLNESDSNDYPGSYEQHASLVTPGSCGNQCEGCSAAHNIVSITFILTENCNLDCTYCYEKGKTKRKMSQEVAKKAIDFILSDKIYPYFDKDRVKGVVIDLFGGEPFMNTEVMNFIADYFNEQCLIKKPEWLLSSMFSTTTNGTLYFSKGSQEFINKTKNKLSLGITIDGDKELHDACRVFHDRRGSYDVVVEGIKHWNQISATVPSTKVTIAPGNVDKLFKAFKHLWEDVGIQVLNSNCVFEEGWTLEHAKELYKQLKDVADYLLEDERYARYYTSFFEERCGDKMDEDALSRNYCGGNGAMLAIGVDGKLYTCMRFAQYALGENVEHSIGDLDNGIQLDDPWLINLKNVTMRSQSPQECLDCEVSLGCGICTGYHYDHFNDVNKRATYICHMHKARVCAAAYYYNKLYKKLNLNKTFELRIPNIYEEES